MAERKRADSSIQYPESRKQNAESSLTENQTVNIMLIAWANTETVLILLLMP
jgi:hypothetical protein